MASSFETLVFELIAKDAQASAAFDRFRNKVDDTSKSVDKNSQSLDKNAKALDSNKQHATSAMGALIGVGTALAPMSSALVAAGAGFTAFAGLAAPSVKTVVTALTGPGGLDAAWMTLDNRQRNAALGVQQLGTRYTGLSKAMEPRTFQVFNQALGLANSLLGPLDKLALNAGTGIAQLMQDLTAHAGLQQFITFLSTISGPSIAMLGGDITSIAHAVFALLQAFGGTGMLELRAFSATIGAVTTSITFLSEHAPGLTSAGLAIGGIALALSKLGLLSGALKITGIANIATQMSGFAVATRGATVAERGLLATTTALDAITPFGWAVLGAAALGGLALALSRVKSGTDTTIASIEKQDQAVGFNTNRYLAAANALGAYNHANEQTRVAIMNLHTGLVTGYTTIGQVTGATAKLTAAQQQEITSARNQSLFLGALQQKYGLTRTAAISLAVHAGVLASEVNKGGKSMKDAAGKADAYANANLAAQRPTSQLAKDMQDFANRTLTATARTTALTNALKLFFNPAVTADQDVVTLKTDQIALAKALDASAGKTGLLTGKQRDARSAFNTYISQVATAASDAFNATGKTSSYTNIINRSLPVLERAAGHNKVLRQEIQDLINTERAMRSENVGINVSARGHWSVQSGGGFKVGPGGLAAGGRITAGTSPVADDVLVRASRDETVVSAAHSRILAPAFAALGVPGYAAGGVVGSYSSASVPGLDKWLKSENSATLTAVASAVAASFKAAASQGFGGGGAAGPGGGAPAANAALAHSLYSALLTPASWAAWNYVAMRESGWSNIARNPSSGAYGIAQALPPTKYPFAGQAAGGSNPMAQISWMWNYMGPRYGGPIGAAAHEAAFNWYHGGLDAIVSKPTLIGVGDGGAEHVQVTPLSRGGGAATVINVNVTVKVGHGTSPRQAAKEIADILNSGATAGVRLRRSILSANG